MPGARPNKYHTHVEPYLKDISEWALTMTEAQICECLGVSKDSFIRYKREHSELCDALQKGRKKLVKELRSALIKRAMGFQYEERRRVLKNGEVISEVVVTRTCPPDVGALHLALKNYDRDCWSNDWQHYDLRLQELALQEKRIDNGEWA